MEILLQYTTTIMSTIVDITPIIAVIFGFQVFILKQPIVNFRKIALGLPPNYTVEEVDYLLEVLATL